MSTDDWVPPDTFRDHARYLLARTALTRAELAVHAGVAPRALDALLDGRSGRPLRRLHIGTARALAATSVESIREAADRPTDADPVRDLLRSLLRRGLTRAALTAEIGPDVELLLAGPLPRRCASTTWVRTVVCYHRVTRLDGPAARPEPTVPRGRRTDRRPTAPAPDPHPGHAAAA